MSRCRVLASLAIASSIVAAPAPALAVQPPERPALPDFDVRGLDRPPAPLTPLQRKALARLEQNLAAVPGGEVVVVTGPSPGTLHHLFRRSGFLTAPTDDDPELVARRFVARHADLLGLAPADVKRLALARRFSDPGTGAVHLHLEQRLADGVEVFHGEVRAHLAADGRLLSVGGDTAPVALVREAWTLDEAAALRAAAASVGIDLSQAPPREAGRTQHGWHRFESDALGSAAIVDPTWFPFDAGCVAAWRVIVEPTSAPGWYQLVVDAADGSILARHDMVAHVATEGLAFRENPDAGPQEWLPFVDGEALTHEASPFGWSEAGLTRGNNCDVKDDLAADNETTEGMHAAATGTDPLRFDAPFSDDPPSDLAASITNLFHLNNWLHDRLSLLGFDEAAGNFQATNASGAGLGDDAVRVDAQDGSGRNNANFGTPPDGLPPRMQMFIWTVTNPNRDSGFDGSVVTHELFHGVSNRLVGGAENAGCLGGAQGGAMGEAWSDFFPCSFWDTPVVGAYVVGNPVRGIRRAPYDTHPYHYGQLCNQGGFQVHRDGEIWAATLWELRERMIARDGHHLGRCRVERLVLDGMKLAPCRPTYVDMRDAILLAARLAGGPGDECLLWEGFAERGLGAGALRTTGCTDGAGVESFDVPAECGACAVATPVVSEIDATAPNEVTVRFAPAAGATAHELLRSQSPCPGPCLDAEFAVVAAGDGAVSELTDRDADGNRLSAGQSFSYRVVASDGACASHSACAQASVTGRCTLRPRAEDGATLGIVALRRPPSATCTMEVEWAPAVSACGRPADIRYNIYRSEDPAFVPGPEHLAASVPAPATRFLDESAPAATLTYIVRAEDLTAGGDGPHGGNEETNARRLTLRPQGESEGVGEFRDDAEGGELVGYRRTGAYAPNDWAIVSDDVTRGGSAWHSDDVEGGTADKNLHLPPVSLADEAGVTPRLTFLHTFDFEDDFDGGVLEISTDGGATWRDLIDDVSAGGYDTSMGTGRTRTVAGLMNPPNTDRLWTGQNASGFGTYDAVEVDLTPYAGTLDAVLRLRLLVDPLAAAPGGWYVDDLLVEGVREFAECATGCTIPPLAAAADAVACASDTETVTLTLDASATDFGPAGPAPDLSLVLTHDGPGTFDGRRWATGELALLSFPAGTPPGVHDVVVTARSADGCLDRTVATVTLTEPGPDPPPLGPTLRVATDADTDELVLSWADVGAPLHGVWRAVAGDDLATALDPAREPWRTSAASSLRVAEPAPLVFYVVRSVPACPD